MVVLPNILPESLKLQVDTVNEKKEVFGRQKGNSKFGIHLRGEKGTKEFTYRAGWLLSKILGVTKREGEKIRTEREREIIEDTTRRSNILKEKTEAVAGSIRRPEEIRKEDERRREDVWKKKNEEKQRKILAIQLREEESKKRIREERRKKESRAERSRRSDMMQSGEFLRRVGGRGD